MSGTAFAANATWNNTATDFNTGANWTGGTGTGGAPGTADVATFAALASVNPDLSAPLTLLGINFSTTGSSGYVIGSANGSALTLTNTGTGATTSAVYNQITSGTNQISTNIILGGAASTTARFAQGTGGTLWLSGNISSTNAITGVNYQPISNSVSSVFTISGNNTYAGTTTLGFATFNVNSATAFSAGTVIFGNNPRFNNTSGASVTINNAMTVGTSFTYSGNSAANELVWAGALDFSGGNRTIATQNAGGRLVFSGVANWGARQHTKDNGGTLVLNNANTGAGVAVTIGTGTSYTSTMKINSGLVEVGNAGAFGTGVVDIRTATLLANTGLTAPIASTFVIGSGSPTIGGAANIELSGPIIQSNGASTSTTLNITNTGATKISGPVSMTDHLTAIDNQTLIVNVDPAAGPAEISGSIQDRTSGSFAGSVGTFAKSGDGTLTLSGANTYTGITDVRAGSLRLTGSLASTSLNLGNGVNSGKLILGGASPTNLTLASVTTTGTGTSNAIVGGSASTSTLTIDSAANSTLVGNLGGSGTYENNLAFTKAGIGTFTINGTHSYVGPTTVNGGKLLLNGSLNSSNVLVNGGTFDGVGSVKSATVAVGQTFAQGNGTTAALTVNNGLTYSGAGTLSLVTSLADSATARLTVGSLTTTGIGSLGLTVGTTDTLWAAGTYNLINYGSLGGSGFAGFVPTASVNVLGLGVRQTKTFTNNGSGLISMTIAGGTPVWTGSVNGNWDYTTANWAATSGPPTFLASDLVAFDNTSATQTVNITTADVNPMRVDVNSGNYTINGPFGIVGTASVLVNAGAGLTLNSSNSYTGGTTVTDASLNLNNANAIGTGALALNGAGLVVLDNTSGAPVVLANNAARALNSDFTFTGSNDLNLGSGAVTMPAARTITVNGSTLTIGGNIASTTASLTKKGAGKLVLSGTNAYTGGTNVSAGELEIAGGSTGSSSSIVRVADLPGQTAILRISAGTLNADQLLIAAGGDLTNPTAGMGTVIQTGGIVNSARWIVLGIGQSYDGSSIPTGTYSISGGELRLAGTGAQIEVASSSSSQGVVNISGSGVIKLYNNQSLALGVHTGAFDGTVNQTGGSVVFYSDAGNTVGGTGVLSLGQAGSPGIPGFYETPVYTYNLDGGSLTVPQIQRNTAATNLSSAILNLNGGVLKAAKSNTTWINPITHAYVKAGGAVIDSNGFDVTIPQVLEASPDSPGGGLTKQGPGTLTLSAVNTYTGPTLVTGGKLLPTGSINSSSSITINGSGAKLVNPGTSITPTVTVNNGTLDGTGSFGTVIVNGAGMW
ncbi:MAG: autotransporter-associated beta strand repeat-containing protein [Tepidisphaeraceae bacterium]